jgi:hypothetical protein
MTMQVTDTTAEILKNQFLGKKISLLDSKGIRWVGKCEFIGPNPFIPSWELQVTIGRTPITNVQIKSIKIED